MNIRRVATVATVMGLIAGLGEGASLLLLQQADLLGWRIGRVPVWTEILAIAPVVDLALFLVAAAGVTLLARMATRFGWHLDTESAVVGVCGALLWFDWLTLLGRLRLYAVVPLAAGLATLTVRAWQRDAVRSRQVVAFALPVCLAAALLTWGGTYGRAWLSERQAIGALPALPAGTPNVLVVVLDTVRADHVSAYGYRRPTTPTIDRLAAEGTLFERAYSTSSWTLPAHGSLMTGLRPRDHGATDARLSDRPTTIAATLSTAGYRTAAFSANLDWFTRRHGFARGFMTFGDFFQSPHDMIGRTIYGRMYDEFAADRLGIAPLLTRVPATDINRDALSWLDRHAGSAPFFLVLNYFDAHGPYEPPQPFRRQFSATGNPGGLLRDLTLRQRPTLTPAQLQGEIDAYDGAIAYLDRQIERLLQDLEARHLKDNTLIIVTSDHGESFGEHDLFTHRTALYADLIHVPLVLRWPGHVPAGTRVTAPVSLTDIPATLTDLAAVRAAPEMPGQSLASTWRAPDTASSRPYPVQELARMPFDEFNWVPAFKGAMWSVVAGNWHYIEHETLGAELYDIVQDPAERTNLLTTAEGAAAAPSLAQFLRRTP